MKKNRIVGLMLAAAMLLSMVSVGTAGAEGTKYTTETTPDGWIKVVNDGGATLGYSPESGVTIIEDSGYAFKDMNKNGALDVYEDWRLDAQARAEGLAALMTPEEQIPLMFVNRYDTNYKAGEVTPFILALLDKGIRGLSTPFAYKNVALTVAYMNGLQSYAEALPYAIPVDEHAEVGGLGIATKWINNLSFGATFDPELVAQYAKSLSKEYSAMGITSSMTPQIDLVTEPRWSRIASCFTEDPQLGMDMTEAFVNAWQSTYDADGNDLGWGMESINTQLKHFPGDGVGESGRESHNFYGAYAVYPGDNFYTQLLPFKAGMELSGATGTASGVMPSYSIGINADGDPLGDDAVGSGFDAFKLTEILREEMGFDGLISSDFIIVQENAGMSPRNWGVQELPVPERYLKAVMAGIDQFGGEAFSESLLEAYQLGIAQYGKDVMDERIHASAVRILKNMFQVCLFDNAYLNTSDSEAIVGTDETAAIAYEMQTKAIALLKNSGNLIQAAAADAGKPTVYIPMTYASGAWSVPLDMTVTFEYFNVVTDKVAETLTGPADKNGKPTASVSDIIRASKEELAACDYALVRIKSPANVGGGYDGANARYIPISLQYGEYTANSQYVRQTSIAGDELEVTINSEYGAQTVIERENRSYFGNTAVISNATDLDAVLYAAEHVDKVIVNISMSNPTIVTEFESQVDAIIADFAMSGASFTKALCEIVTGKIEPSALLPFQMPANMDTVEAQYEDVPRDMECYVDAEGNTYDFAFGLNWSGVISDERVEKYSVPPLEG